MRESPPHRIELVDPPGDQVSPEDQSRVPMGSQDISAARPSGRICACRGSSPRICQMTEDIEFIVPENMLDLF